MLTSKIICDDAYSNKSWCIVGQGTFTFREINQIERKMCSYLEWQLSVDPSILQGCIGRFKSDRGSCHPSPCHQMRMYCPSELPVGQWLSQSSTLSAVSDICCC